MANTKISQLPTYTGDTTGVYVVMDNSGLTQSYKVLNSSLGIPPWVSAGTIQSVGWGATTTAPTIGGTSRNNISYRQTGSKQWEVAMAFDTTGSGAATGNGDYLFTLPNGLLFDTTLGWQTVYTGGVLTSDTILGKVTIPSGGGMISDGAGSVTTNFMPIVWDSTRFRIMAHQPGVAVKCIGSNWYQVTATIGFTLTFTLTSA